jgi:cation transport ATPase
MKTEKIEIDGMTCESCERLITKSVAAAGGKIQKISASEGFAIIECTEGGREKMEKAIEAAGYSIGVSASQVPFERQLSAFITDFLASKPAAKPVRDCFTYSVISFILLAAALFLLFGSSKYFIYFIYAAISAVAIAGGVALASACKRHITCMEGMMLGMTIGMSAGFLFGAIIGASNGMFIGSMFGMLIGMALGAFTGKYCGIMGAMEGLMAGVMGGTMGAMLAVMMQFDNLALFMPIFVLANLLVLAGLKYMLYYYPGRRGTAKQVSAIALFGLALLLTALTVAVALYAPRTGVVI